jgi:FMN reductase
MVSAVKQPWQTKVAVVVGDLEAHSRTLEAATSVARELVGHEPDVVVDLVEDEVEVDQLLVFEVCSCDLVVFACPTGGAGPNLLESFVDALPTGGLSGIAVPLMLGSGPGGALAPDLELRPELSRISRIEPAKGLYVVDACYDDPAAYEWWLALARPVISALLASRADIPA